MDARLGVGTVLSGSFGLFFRTLYILVPLIFVPYFLSTSVSVLAMPDLSNFVGSSGSTFEFNAGLYFVSQVLTVFVSLWVMIVGIAAATDLHSGRGIRLVAWLARGFTAFPAVLVLGIVFMVLLALPIGAGYGVLVVLNMDFLDLAFAPSAGALGLIALVLLLPLIGSLYLGARFGLFVVAVIAERAGLRGLSRASHLTEGHRWAVLGAYMLTLLCMTGVLVILWLVLGLVLWATATTVYASLPGNGILWMTALVAAFVNAIFVAFLASHLAVVFARLRHLKEGGDVREMVTVFE